MAEVDGGVVQGQAAPLCPKVELVSLSSTVKAAKEAVAEMDGEATAVRCFRSLKRTLAAKLLAAAGCGGIAYQGEHTLDGNLTTQSWIVDEHLVRGRQGGHLLASLPGLRWARWAR
jgi:hypothetical protein